MGKARIATGVLLVTLVTAAMGYTIASAVLTYQDLEMATLGWVGWFNNRRLLGPIGNIPPAEAEENFYAQRDVLDMVA